MSSVASLPVEVVHLQHPRRHSGVSVEQALAGRRSVRSFGRAHLARGELSQLLWAAQGISSGWGARTAPSAGALYPLDVYVATPESLGRYLPDGHRLLILEEEDLRPALAEGALGQEAVAGAAAVFAVTAVYERSSARYGPRAERYAQLEAGHVAENILLQAVALELGGVPVGAFDDAAVQRALRVPADHAPLYLLAIGRPEG